ncbi:MAG TPA: hypothetical protein VF503_23240 [Sphingobium sp.]|uniref:hypothetical protein n=1 Tax=Sphingobium sp. TaxID=1912891 RepID=UPI002ED393EB
MGYQASHLINMAISFAIVAVIMVIRMRRMGQERPLKLERLWVVPAIYGAVALVTFWFIPPHGMAWLYCVAALIVGGALGWYRGKMVAISIDPATHRLNQKTSPAAMAFVLGIVVIRLGARTLAVEMSVGNSMLMVMTDILIAFALGFLPVQRLEMGLRASRLLREVRSA